MRWLAPFVAAGLFAAPMIAQQQYDTNGGALVHPIAPLPSWYYGKSVIGSYIALSPSGTYTGMAADTEFFSLRYTGKNTIVVTKSLSAIYIVGNFSGSQLVGFYCKKAEAFTVDDSGGSDISTTLISRLDSLMPAPSGMTAHLAGDGSTGLTAGTRTLTNNVLRGSMVTTTGQVGSTSNEINDFLSAESQPLVIRQNEGIICYNTYALGGSGSIRFRLGMNFQVLQ